MRLRLPALTLGVLLLAFSAAAHAAGGGENPVTEQGANPNFRSLITSVSPHVPGLSLQILQFSDRLRLTDKTGQTVTVLGYQNEPYARLLPDGTVEQNTRSPAVYLNTTFFATATVPASANPNAPPKWSVVDRTGTFEWHDHRIHWLSPALPPQVKDTSKRVKIFNWKVPITVGSTAGGIFGQLVWVPESSGFPVAAIVALVVVIALSALLVLFVRRRRSGGGPGGPGREATPQEPVSEAW